MDGITHHLNDEILMAYSAGTLPEGYSLVVATHVSLCDECRARMESFDTLGGALIETADAVDMAPDSLDATLALIAGFADAPPEAPRCAVPGSVFPKPLQDYVGGDLDAVRWRSVGGGVRQAVIQSAGSSKVRLLHIPGGVRMPDHGHRGVEMTLVLRGAFSDEFGRFGRGDVEIADESLEHTPIAEAGEDCICLAATDAPLRFNALLPRIAQPFLGI